MKWRLFATVGSIITMLAMTVTSTACYWVLYQPKVPKTLMK